MNFEEMEQKISDYAKTHHAALDYTAQSIGVLHTVKIYPGPHKNKYADNENRQKTECGNHIQIACKN